MSSIKWPAGLAAAAALLCTIGAIVLACLLVCYVDAGKHDNPALRSMLSAIACLVGLAIACLGFGLAVIQPPREPAIPKTPEDESTTGESPPAASAGIIFVVCATIVIALALNLGVNASPAPSDATQPSAATAPAPPTPQDAGAQ